MKKVLLSSVVMAFLVFSGCSDKDPAVDEKSGKNIASEEVVVDTENVTPQDSSVGENRYSDSVEKSMANLENDLSSVYFDYDKFVIRSDMQTNIATSVTIANGSASNFNIKLEGNCDEWGSDEYNFALGLKRASAVKKAMIADGVNESRITMVSYGESNPTCSNKTQDCWAKNRRVDFKLLP